MTNPLMPETPPPPFDHDPRPVVAIFRAPLFNESETFVRAQAAGLDRYQPLLLGLEDKGNIPPRLADRVLLKGARGWSGFAKRVRPYAPVLVHAHFATDGLRALALAERLGVPLVTHLRGYDVTRSTAFLLLSGRRSWLNYALRGAALRRRGALFLAVSDALRRQAIARGFPADLIRVHYNGVDLARFAPGAGDDITILFVGRLVEKKGVEYLLEAFASVWRTRPEVRLVVIGDGPLRTRLERRAGEGVRFLGRQPPEAVADWMKRAALLAAPSVTASDGDSEGLPNTIVEAAAAGLPAVGTDHAGIPEAIVDGETGFIVPERDADSLAARLLTLLGNPDLRRRMGAAARALAERKFDFARQMNRLEAIYDELRTGRCG
ncbi:MAG: glycosyltransferase [Sphingomonadaceae bacterium]|nr:glycosyltransferase [Sphingomonadaceae bacterium]